ncbi:hypothetical protein ACQ4PT_020118 [Festuca glaucescens]
MVASTHVGVKMRQAHVLTGPAAAVSPAVTASVAPAPAPALKRNKTVPSLGPKKARAKKPASRKKATPPPVSAPPPPSANEVLDEMSAPSASYMGLLNDAEVNIGAPPLDSFDFEGEEEEEEEASAEEEEVAEINEAAFQTAQEEGGARRPIIRSSNYTEIEDVLLVRAWSKVGMDAVHGMDQTGKRYWQRIEDKYCKLKPKTGRLVHRSYRSLQGRWEVIKPACARWSAAMDQVINAPPSGTVESDYVSILNLTLWFMPIFTLCTVVIMLCFRLCIL